MIITKRRPTEDSGTAAFTDVSAKRQPSFGAPKSESANTIIAILETAGSKFTDMALKTESSETEAVAAYGSRQRQIFMISRGVLELV